MILNTAQVITTIFVAGTFFIYLRQWREMQKQVSAANAQALAATNQTTAAFKAVMAANDQLGLMQKQLDLAGDVARNQNLVNFIAFLQAEPMRLARRIVYLVRDHNVPLHRWTAAQRAAGQRVAMSFTIAGAYVKGGVLPERYFKEQYAWIVRECFRTLLPMMEEDRQRRTDTWDSFFWLTQHLNPDFDALLSEAKKPRTGEALGIPGEERILDV
jgi:hypothetical protein